MDEPKRAKSSTESEAPNRTKLLMAIEEPRCTISKTDRENTDPSLDNPSNDTEDPRRLKDLRDIDEPSDVKSNNAKVEPRRT
jgi:hypothetical protein